MGTKRYIEAMDQAFEQFVRRDLFNQARISNVSARIVDAEEVNKCRIGRFLQESNEIKKWNRYSEYEDEREKLRSRKGDYDTDCIEFSYSDNFCQMYFDYYGHGFREPWCPKGGRTVNEPNQGWTCPKCHREHRENLFDLKYYCENCGGITPMGEMIRDGVFRRY